jgi:diaminopimelate decarboxylase
MPWWENDFLSVRNNRVRLAGVDASALAEKHGTPIYVYGRDSIISKFRALQGLLGEQTSLESRICYAMKANPHAGILKALKDEGAWIDAVSPNEVRTAMKAGFPASRILYTGTSVSTADLEAVFGIDGLTVNIDAAEQLELMREVRERSFRGKRVRVSVRWNPGKGRGFSPKAVTAGERASDGTPIKFGVEEKKVKNVFIRTRKAGFLPVGLHQHLGSGWVREDFTSVRRAVDGMLRKAEELESLGFDLEFLDFGGGFGPKYFRNQSLFPTPDYIRYVCESIRKAGLRIKAVAIEPGKYLVGDSGVLLLRVEYVKESYGNIFACVNGGTFNTVPRPAIYMQARHEIVNCLEVDASMKTKVTVAGHLCETGDVFGKERLMPLPRRGGLLAVLCAGGYCRSMASNYNLREIPKEILI